MTFKFFKGLFFVMLFYILQQKEPFLKDTFKLQE